MIELKKSSESITTGPSQWRPELRPYQLNYIEALKDFDGDACFADMGTGKTLIIISLFEYWYSQGDRRMVYVCQNSLRDSMGDEFKKWNSPLKVCVLQPGSRPRRLKQIQGDWDVLIVNYEATRGLWADIIRMRPQVLAVDESQNIKHRTALQTKAIRKIAEATKILGGHRVLMSGTPITKNALNLWSQTDILYPEKMPSKHPLGFGSYRAYERTVSEVKPHPRLGMRAPIHEFRPERVAEVLEHMAPYTRVIRSEDVLPELPPQSFITVRLHMEDEQRRIYNALKRDMVAVLDRTAVDAVSAGILATYGVKPLAGNLTEDDFTVVSNLATTLKIRLQQVTSGFVKTATGAEVSIPSIKHEWLADELPLLTEPDGDHKTVIFCKFIHDVSSILDLCGKMDIGAVRMDGQSQKTEKASDAVRRFQNDPGIRVLVSNIQVSATGFTLTAADSSVFFSNSYRYDHRVQAVKRTHRIGQTRPVRYYDPVAAAVDENILQSLSTTQDVAVTTLDQLRELVDAL